MFLITMKSGLMLSEALTGGTDSLAQRTPHPVQVDNVLGLNVRAQVVLDAEHLETVDTLEFVAGQRHNLVIDQPVELRETYGRYKKVFSMSLAVSNQRE